MPKSQQKRRQMNILNIVNKNWFGMPRVRLLNTIFHSGKINAKQLLNS